MEDSGIIELYLRRDEGAIRQTELKYGAYCRAIALNVLSVPEDAEECVNDAYFQAWSHIPPQRPKSLKIWLGKVVRNGALNLWKKNHRKKRYSGMEILLDELEDCIPAPDAAARRAESAEISGVLSAWLRTLPEEDRRLFVRRYWNGEPLRVLARSQGVAPDKLAQRMLRLRRGLRQVLESEGIAL